MTQRPAPRHTIASLTVARRRDGILRAPALGMSHGDQYTLELSGAREAPELEVVVRGCDGMIRSRALADWYEDIGLTTNAQLLVRRTGRRRARISPLGRSFSFIDLFAGIGGFRLGFEAADGTCVFSSEIDADACDTYEANFDERPHGDITRIDADDVPVHDVLLAGFPCQPFSIIGKRQGFEDTRGTLFFDVARITRHRRPNAVVLENVKQFRTHDGGRTCATVVRTLRDSGYHQPRVAVLNALDFGCAQRRERAFVVAIRDDLPDIFQWPEPYSERADLTDVLEADEKVSPSLRASDHIRRKRLARLEKQGRIPEVPSVWHENKGGHIGVHPYSCAMRANASYNYLLVNGRRRPTGREMLRLQGFPEHFVDDAVPHSAIRRQCGNTVAVPVAMELASSISNLLRIAAPA